VKKALTEEEPYLYRHFGYREIGKEESGVSTHELARSRVTTSTFWNWALVIVLWSHEKWSSRLVLFAQGSFRKDLWID
jgi:hypothetical protein